MGRRQWVALAAFIVVSILSGMVIYPAVHEAGHLIAGRMQGLHVREVVWTNFGGSPHVGFEEQRPPAVEAWVAPAGLISPTVVGTAILLIWMFVPRLPWLLKVVLWIPGFTLLFGNFGAIAEIRYAPGDGYSHMRPPAEYLHLSGPANVGFQLLPALYSLAFFAFVVMYILRVRRQHRQCEQVQEASRQQ